MSIEAQMIDGKLEEWISGILTPLIDLFASAPLEETLQGYVRAGLLKWSDEEGGFVGFSAADVSHQMYDLGAVRTPTAWVLAPEVIPAAVKEAQQALLDDMKTRAEAIGLAAENVKTYPTFIEYPWGVLNSPNDFEHNLKAIVSDTLQDISQSVLEGSQDSVQRLETLQSFIATYYARQEFQGLTA